MIEDYPEVILINALFVGGIVVFLVWAWISAHNGKL
jgi:hypothetical protein